MRSRVVPAIDDKISVYSYFRRARSGERGGSLLVRSTDQLSLNQNLADIHYKRGDDTASDFVQSLTRQQPAWSLESRSARHNVKPSRRRWHVGSKRKVGPKKTQRRDSRQTSVHLPTYVCTSFSYHSSNSVNFPSCASLAYKMASVRRSEFMAAGNIPSTQDKLSVRNLGDTGHG